MSDQPAQRREQALHSALDRLRVAIIICDECQVLRPLNGRGTALFEAEKLTGDLLSARPSHPFVRGLSNVAIGRQIGISPETVKTHVRSIFAKSGTQSRRVSSYGVSVGMTLRNHSFAQRRGSNLSILSASNCPRLFQSPENST